MTEKKDQIVLGYIGYRPLGEKSKNQCPLTQLGESKYYCSHPGVRKKFIACNYGVREKVVPKDCPLRKDSLTIKISLLEDK